MTNMLVTIQFQKEQKKGQSRSTTELAKEAATYKTEVHVDLISNSSTDNMENNGPDDVSEKDEGLKIESKRKIDKIAGAGILEHCLYLFGLFALSTVRESL